MLACNPVDLFDFVSLFVDVVELFSEFSDCFGVVGCDACVADLFGSAVEFVGGGLFLKPSIGSPPVSRTGWFRDYAALAVS